MNLVKSIMAEVIPRFHKEFYNASGKYLLLLFWSKALISNSNFKMHKTPQMEIIGYAQQRLSYMQLLLSFTVDNDQRRVLSSRDAIAGPTQ